MGVAWAGVCEDFLGSEQDAPTVRQLVHDIQHHPGKFGDYTGSFSLCAWQESENRAAILTGATQCQTLWQTSGPQGWAAGSRARPLLAMVGRDPELNHEAATVFIAYGYLLDDEALFKHVIRIPSRTCITLERQNAPVQRIYISLSDYFGEPLAGSLEDVVDLSAEQIIQRVRRQLRHSLNPRLHLTGGRDSRCMAAALSLSGFTGPALTGGTAVSKDVVVASKVARKLGITHAFSGVSATDRSILETLPRERLKAWTWISEGVETIRHGLYYIDYLLANGQPVPKTEQHFIGLHAGLAKPILNRDQPALINKNVGTHLPLHKKVTDRFNELKEGVDAEIEALHVPRFLWGDIFHWQVKALHWGQDNGTVKDLFFWWWTPLLDRTLIRAGWLIPENLRLTPFFIEAVTDRLVPKLSKLEYDKTPSKKNIIERLTVKTKNTFNRLYSKKRASTSVDSDRKIDNMPMWEQMLFDIKNPVWKDLIDERYLRSMIEQKKGNIDMAWSTLTVQLFNETFMP